MAERSKALRSGRSPVLWAWVRIPLLTEIFLPFGFSFRITIVLFSVLSRLADLSIFQRTFSIAFTSRIV